MQNRAVIYFRKSKARKVLEQPLTSDLKTFLSATLALSRNNVVKKHIHGTLQQLHTEYSFKLSA